MKKKKVCKPVAVLLAAMLALWPVMAQAAEIKDMTVANNRDDLLLYFSIDGAFNQKLAEAVNNGIPTTFSITITIEEKRTLLPDRTIAEKLVTHTITYDPIKKVYTVIRSWEGGSPMTTDSFEEAKIWMTRVSCLPIAPLSALEKGETYIVYAKAKLDKVTLPLLLHYLFFFVSLWDFETDWQEIEFVYDPNP